MAPSSPRSLAWIGFANCSLGLGREQRRKMGGDLHGATSAESSLSSGDRLGTGPPFKRTGGDTAETGKGFQRAKTVPWCSSTVSFAAVPIFARNAMVDEPACFIAMEMLVSMPSASRTRAVAQSGSRDAVTITLPLTNAVNMPALPVGLTMIVMVVVSRIVASVSGGLRDVRRKFRNAASTAFRFHPAVRRPPGFISVPGTPGLAVRLFPFAVPNAGYAGLAI